MATNNINIIKRSLFFILLSIIIVNAQAQIGLNFQGVARTNNNVILSSQAITIKLSILQGSATGTLEYTETKRVITNAQGLFTAVIGDTGAISTIGNFTTINWKLSPKFLKIEMDAAAGNNFIIMGTTQFQYVAYAQFAKSVDAENLVGVVPVARGGTGATNLSTFKSSLAIDKLNNTADADKPISATVQAALDLKSSLIDTSKYTKQTYTDSALLTKLKISDTAAMLSSRIARDTLNLSNRINLKANTTDVASGLDLKLNAADTIKYTKQTYTDSALLTKLKISDTAAMLSSRIARDTLNLSNRINLKANTTDVASGLALKENTLNKSTAVDLGGTSPSDILFPTQKAVKDYVTANNASGGISDGSIITIKIADDAVTDAKINTVSGSKVIGNITGNAATASLAGNITATANTTLTSLSNLNTVGIITSGVWSATELAIEKGGTGAITASAARTNLGLAVGSDVLAYRTFGTAANNNTADFEVPLTLTSPLSRVTNTISIPAATTSVNGYLSSTDWTIFNAKQTALTAGSGISISAGTISATGLTASNLSSTAGITNAQLGGSIAASKLVGTDITTVGTITSGTWSGTAVAVEKGGTGATTASAARTNLGLVIGINVQAPLVAGTDYLAPVSLTTTGASGASTFISNILNIPTYTLAGLGGISLSGVSATAPLSYNSGTGVFSIPIATTSANGYLSSTDWTTFNAKQTALTAGSGISISAGTISATGLTTSNLSSTAGITNAQLAGSIAASKLVGTDITTVGTLANLTVTNPIAGSITGNAATATTATTAGTASIATKLATPKNINGVSFDGSLDIIVMADAGTLTGTALNSTITGSSLMSVGTLANLTVTNPINGSITGNAATSTLATNVTTNANLTGIVTSVGNTTEIANLAINDAKIASVSATKITGTLLVLNGGTGSTTQNFVDLTTIQNIAGQKTFSSDISVNGIIVGQGGGGISSNTANGNASLYSNTTGSYNTASGNASLYKNMTGNFNTANGNQSLENNTTGYSNTANGNQSLLFNTIGFSNTANGNESIRTNTTGTKNTANGDASLYFNTTGSYNTASGNRSLFSNTTGDGNTAIGYNANVGSNALSNATAIGNGAIVNNSNTIQLGNEVVTNVKTYGTITAGAITYPKLDGTANQVLTTNGSGVATFGSIPTLNQNTTGSAATLTTARNINGVAFDGSQDINVSASADAGTLTGTALNSTITGSSLTSVGTLANLTVTNSIAGSITGNAATATLATIATTAGNITATANTTLTSLSNLNTVGTITSGIWSGTAVAVEKGGTGATTASAARTNLGLVIGINVQAPLVAGTDYLAPVSLTTTGASGASTFISNTLNIPTYTLAGLGGISLSGVSATAPLSYNSGTGVFSIPIATTNANGYLSSTDWTTFNAKQTALTAGSGISISAGTISATGLTASNLSSTAGITNAQLGGSIAASKLVGTDITTVGTITSGTWNGTTLAIAKGGTGLIAAGTNGQVLTSTGSETLIWTTPSGGGDVHTIGETYGGGIVFYVYDNGKHGLIAATSDKISGVRWYGGTNTNTRARADGVGAGLKNTVLIIANQGALDVSAFAATFCNEYSVNVGGVTYGDWYLPSKHELDLLYLKKSVVGGFGTGFYWSSTEFFSDQAWAQDFYDGQKLNSSKNLSFNVRAIRAF